MAYKQLKLWFDEELAKLLANKITLFDKGFDSSRFQKAIKEGVDPLELKDRVELIADLLNQNLKGDYKKKVKTLLQILGPENEKEEGMFKLYYWIMPIAKFVEKYGLDHFDISMKAILEITKRNTSEYAIRPFIQKHPEKTLSLMLEWTKDSNKHVRRLASEGGRPRLPWAPKLQQFIDDPSPLFPILDNLKDDTSKYVQKSVANCVNDFIKDNLEMAKSLIEKWSNNPSKERTWIIKHALRNLRKKEDAWALEVISKIEKSSC